LNTATGNRHNKTGKLRWHRLGRLPAGNLGLSKSMTYTRLTG